MEPGKKPCIFLKIAISIGVEEAVRCLMGPMRVLCRRTCCDGGVYSGDVVIVVGLLQQETYIL